MKIVTIDASAAASWLLPSQRTLRADAFIAERMDRRLIAPDVFAWEVGNLIAGRAARNLIDRDAALTTLELLGVEVFEARDAPTVLAMIEPAVRSRLSLFDFAYLELALEQGAALASRDQRLINAARNEGVEVFDLRDAAA